MKSRITIGVFQHQFKKMLLFKCTSFNGRAFVFTCIFFCLGFTLQAQKIEVSGVVSDKAGIPVPGVNVIVKNTNTGVQTDFDGAYTIEVLEGETLVFSYIGFKTYEVGVNAESREINVILKEDLSNLDEVMFASFK